MRASKLVSAVAAGCFAVATCLGVAGCAGSNGSDAVAATVNDTKILESDVTSSIEAIRSNYGLTDDDSWGKFLAQNNMTPESVREQMIDSYVDQALAEQGASDRGVTVDDEEVDSYVQTMKANYSGDDAWTNALKEAGFTEDSYRDRIKESLISQKLSQSFTDAVSDDSLTSDTLNSYASMYASYFKGAKKSSHILFAADDTETAQKVLDQINSGEITFEDAAKQYSTDTGSAFDGGNVGWDKLNSFVSEYTDALANLDKDQVSGLVTSTYGIHIIKCTDVFQPADDETVAFDSLPSEFQDTIKSMLKSNQGQTDYQNWLADQKENANIVINDMPKNLSYYVDMSKYESDSSASSSDDSNDSSTDDASSSDSDGAETTVSSDADSASSASSAAE